MIEESEVMTGSAFVSEMTGGAWRWLRCRVAHHAHWLSLHHGTARRPHNDRGPRPLEHRPRRGRRISFRYCCNSVAVDIEACSRRRPLCGRSSRPSPGAFQQWAVERVKSPSLRRQTKPHRKQTVAEVAASEAATSLSPSWNVKSCEQRTRPTVCRGGGGSGGGGGGCPGQHPAAAAAASRRRALRSRARLVGKQRQQLRWRVGHGLKCEWGSPLSLRFVTRTQRDNCNVWVEA